MLGKLRRKFLQTKPPVEQDKEKELVLANFQALTTNGSTSDVFPIKKPPDDDSNFQNQESQEDCKCSPLLHFQKHFFGSLRHKKVTDTHDGRISMTNGIGESKEDLKEQPPEPLVKSKVYHSTENADRHSVQITSDDCRNCELAYDQFNGVGCSSEKRWRESFPSELKVELNAENAGLKSTNEMNAFGHNAVPLSEKVSPPKLRRKEREKILGGDEHGGCSKISDDRLVKKVSPVLVEHGFHVLTNASTSELVFATSKTNALISNQSDDVVRDNSTVICNSENPLSFRSDDKEESTDSGHHPSEGDAEKGQSSPDVDLDECDGRESGYTTLDDVQPILVQPLQLLNKTRLVNDDVFEQYSVQNSKAVAPSVEAMEFHCQPLDLSMSTGQFRSSNSSMPVGDVLSSGDRTLSASHRHTYISEPYPLVLGDTNAENSQLWDHVDYVPADVSVSKIYEEGSNAGTSEVYASVPKCFVSKSDDCSANELTANEGLQIIEHKSETSSINWSPKREDGCMQGAVDARTNGASFVLIDSSADVWEDSCRADLTIVSPELDSDDGEAVPPLPSRNYEPFLSSVNMEFNETESRQTADEQIHMTWEELIKEAKCMGIPLNGPHVEKSHQNQASHLDDRSDILIPKGSQMCQSVQCTLENSSQHPNQVSKSKGNKGSPFKEKFRLPNPFSKKSRLDAGDSLTENDVHRQREMPNSSAKTKKSIFRHHSSVDIQKRCLPRPPQDDGQHDDSFAVVDQEKSGNAGNRRMAVSLHFQEPIEAETNRNSWGSSNNLPRKLSLGDRSCQSRRGFSDSSQCLSVSSGHEHVTGVVPESSPSVSNSSNNADFIQSFSKLKDVGWYWGPLGWENAEAKLEDKPDGSFLVRDSSDDRYILSLSFRSQNVTHHTRIEHYKGMFSFYSQPKSHGASTIVEFIEKAMEHSRSGKFLYFLRPRAPGLPPAPVQLLFPVSRLRNMHSLQHICRFVILKRVRRDLIDHLPIPPRLKDYLKQTQYYVECSDCDSMGGHQYFSQDW